jgi:hypothetical protein
VKRTQYAPGILRRANSVPGRGKRGIDPSEPPDFCPSAGESARGDQKMKGAWDKNVKGSSHPRAGFTRANHLTGIYKTRATKERSSNGMVKVRLAKVFGMCETSCSVVCVAVLILFSSSSLTGLGSGDSPGWSAFRPNSFQQLACFRILEHFG